jgi:hypothetical protein
MNNVSLHELKVLHNIKELIAMCKNTTQELFQDKYFDEKMYIALKWIQDAINYSEKPIYNHNQTLHEVNHYCSVFLVDKLNLEKFGKIEAIEKYSYLANIDLILVKTIYVKMLAIVDSINDLIRMSSLTDNDYKECLCLSRVHLKELIFLIDKKLEEFV